MELLITQLTDIHIRDNDDFDIVFKRTDSIGGAICDHITDPDNTEVLFCITGDFVFEGLEYQYEAVGMIIEAIYMVIKSRFPMVGIYPLFVPGNHDCDFKTDENSLRETVLASPVFDISDASQFKICTAIQKNYFAFCDDWNKNYGAMSCASDKVLTVNELNLENIHIQIHCINTSWCSKKHEEKGKMKITTGKMKMEAGKFPEKKCDDIVITMMHHSAEWLDWDDRDVWDEYHRKYSDIILVGHEHKAECVKKTNYDETTNMFIMGNQLFDKYLPDQSGFNILKIITGIKPMQECFFTYEWDGNIYRKVIDTKYQPFIRNKFAGNGVNLKKDIWKFLESIDIDIHRKGIKRELKLSDVYGFPTLTQEEGKTTRFFRNMKSLLEYIDESSYVSIRGQKEFGKTALLKQIFKEYFQQKKFPVFLDIAKINTADGEELNRIIADRYQQTYEGILPEEIMQKDSKERICIIDNFEEISLSDRNAKKLLEYMTNKFGKVILSRNHRLDLISPASYVEVNDFIENKFGILVIQPVRKSYKERIINKWLMLDDEGPDIGSPAFDAKRREKYDQIQTVMKGSYFNRTPIDLLLVLSYLDQDEPIQIDYSRYSFIYDKMILDKLNSIGNKETRSVFTYKTILQDIAFKMFQDGIQGYVDESYVIGAVLDYKETHSGFNMKSDELVRRLVNFGFLDCKNDTYRFKYSYMCYYFAGSYIDKRLHPDERKNVIKDIFCNIDKDLNYNIAIFLAYCVNIEHEILPIIIGLEENLLSEFRDFRYEEIGKLIGEWGGDIEKKVARIYVVPENDNIPALRERKLNELEDKEIMEELEEEKSDKSEKSTTDEDVRKLNGDVIKISRLIDFMGNILKNYSGGMDNHPRESMIDLMFKSAIKIIGSFCSISMYIVDRVIEMLEKKIKEGDEEEIEVKSDFIEETKFLFAEIWCQFISKNISALACSFDCEDIKGNLEAYCASKETEFIKMTRVEYLIRISSIKLPVKEIRNLFKGKEALGEASKNIFKNNIYMYLRNYQFDNRDRQTVCSILEFDIKNMMLEEQKVRAIMDK